MSTKEEQMKILLCSDGSEQAERAVRLGANIATACHAEVTLLGVAEAGSDKELMASLQRSQAVLRDKKVHAETVAASGSPIEEIVRRTEAHGFDLVVIGAVRKASRGSYWMSSKTYKLIKEIKPPVLSVAGRNTNINRILICSGGKSYVNEAVGLIGRIAAGLPARAQVLHVMPELPPFYAQLPGISQGADWVLTSETELGRTLRQARDVLSAAGVETEVKLRQGPVLGEVLREIHEGNYDMVVSGSAVSRGLTTYVLGDLTREIVNHAECAVLVVRSRQKPADLSKPWGKWFGKFATV